MSRNSVSISLEGLPELKHIFDELGKTKAKRVMFAAVKRAMKPVVEDAKRRAPVDTGRLRDSIQAFGAGVGSDGFVVQAGAAPGATREDTSGAWYAKIVEYRKPYMRPAFDQHQAAIQEAMTQALQDAMDEVMNR